MSGVFAVMAGLSEQSAPGFVVFDFSTGSGAVTVPATPSSVVIEAWGGGGGGGFGIESTGDGGGGGAGGYAKVTIALTGADTGKTILYAVGVAGTGSNNGDPGNTGTASVVSSGTFTLTPLQAQPGAGGTSDGNTTQGAGGTASGGDTNTTGAGGALFTRAGAAATAGDGGLLGGAGGDGGIPNLFGDTGASGLPGRVRFVFTV